MSVEGGTPTGAMLEGNYPVTMGEPFYFLTTPIFQHVVLHLGSGKNVSIDLR